MQREIPKIRRVGTVCACVRAQNKTNFNNNHFKT